MIEPSKDAYYYDETGMLLKGDCLEWMEKIPNNSIDMILCDLPYGVTARNKWDVTIPFESLWKSYERLIKGNGAIILTAIEPFSSLLITSNLRMFRYDLIWEKPLAIGFLNANRMPLRNHEQILVFYNKLPVYNPQFTEGEPYTMIRRGDTSNYQKMRELHYKTESNGKRYPKSVQKFSWDREKLHPTQKPVALFEYLIKTYTNEGMTVLDNAAGSCTTAIACINTNRQWICIEKEEKYCAISKERIENHKRNNIPSRK